MYVSTMGEIDFKSPDERIHPGSSFLTIPACSKHMQYEQKEQQTDVVGLTINKRQFGRFLSL